MLKVLIKAESRYPVDRKQIRIKVQELLSLHGIEKEAEVSIFFVGDRKMTTLNKKYLDKDKTTDVLSFPVTENGQRSKNFVMPPDNILYLGDIFISFPQARRQAMQWNRTVDEEINLLVKHGLLHLLGIHHD